MIIARFSWKVKIGCRDEVIKLVKAIMEELGFTPRVCTYVWGSQTTAGIVTSDLEFETMEDMNKFWDNLDPNQSAWVEWHKRYSEGERAHAGGLRRADLIESFWSELLETH